MKKKENSLEDLRERAKVWWENICWTIRYVTAEIKANKKAWSISVGVAIAGALIVFCVLFPLGIELYDTYYYQLPTWFADHDTLMLISIFAVVMSIAGSIECLLFQRLMDYFTDQDSYVYPVID